MNTINDEITIEANEILYSQGLFDLINKYGKGILTGSYSLECMAWRDLDIYIVNDNLCVNSFFQLGNDLANLLNTPKMNYRNELISHRKNLPEGLYWGIYFNNNKSKQWKIDIWMINSKEYMTFERHTNDLKSKITEELRLKIIEIKAQFCFNPKYRKDFTSQDIYRAVLDDKVLNVSDFKSYIQNEKGIEL
jgi:hypothetical protein